MQLIHCLAYLVILPFVLALNGGTSSQGAEGDELNGHRKPGHRHRAIAPKVLIVNLYDEEGESFYNIPAFNVLAHNVSVAGLSPLFPDVHCTSDGAICEVILGEGEINAASSLTALAFSPLFDLRATYFLIAGVAGVDPRVATIGSVTFARYAVQVDLQYAWDPRELPANLSADAGYIPLGTMAPDAYPTEIYGTEVFELNLALRDRAIDAVKAANVSLNDTADAAAYRALFAKASDGYYYTAALSPPAIVECDSATSNIYYSGTLLNDAFRNYTALVTNGTGLYCTSQQEDSAVLEVLIRSTLANRTDFARAIVMRGASDFVSPPPTVSTTDNLFYGQSGYVPALLNLPIVGVPVIQAIIRDWDAVYRKGVRPSNYVGDILGSLGGTPNFGMGAVEEPEPLQPLSYRQPSAMKSRRAKRVADSVRARKRLPSLPINL